MPRKSRAAPRFPRLGACLLVASTASACGDGQTIPVELVRADSVVADWAGRERVAGAVLVVTQRGRVVLERAYGSTALYEYGDGQYPGSAGPTRLADPLPMAVGTVFDLASVTKVMATTLALMALEERGSVDVESLASDYLFDFTGDGKEEITLRDLLTHRSGLAQWKPTYYHASSAQEGYEYIRDLPLEWSVGVERHYSDLGFMVLGRIVEMVSGTRLDEFVRTEIYGPLGLETIGYRPIDRTFETGPTPGRPDGYAWTSHGNPFERRMVHDDGFGYTIDGNPDRWNGWRERTLVGEVNDGNAFHAFRGVAGHAGLFSDAHDLASALDVVLAAAADRPAGVRSESSGFGLSRRTVELFLTPTGNGQALGWQLPDYAPAGSFGHTGFTGTLVLGVPSLDLGIVLLTNRQNVGVDDGTQYPDVGPLQRAVVAALTMN